MLLSRLVYPVDPNWFENRWYAPRSRPVRRSFAIGVARLASLALLLTGGSATAAHATSTQEAKAAPISYMGASKDLFIYFMP